MSQRWVKLQQWGFSAQAGSLAVFGLVFAFAAALAEHLEDMLPASFTFQFLTQPLAQASCLKGNYASFMLS